MWEKVKSAYARITKFGDSVEDFISVWSASRVFILSLAGVTGWWMWKNTHGTHHHPDPYPFELLTLLYSILAEFQMLILLVSDIRKAKREKKREAEEAAREKERVELEDRRQEEVFAILEGISGVLHHLESKELENER